MLAFLGIWLSIGLIVTYVACRLKPPENEETVLSAVVLWPVLAIAILVGLVERYLRG